MRFHSRPIAEHEEVPLADDGQWETLTAYWTERKAQLRGHDRAASTHQDQDARPRTTQDAKPNACYVVSVGALHGDAGDRDAQLDEILGLVRAQGDRVVGHEIHQRGVKCFRPHPRTFLGRGACDHIAERARACSADMIVIDADLSPSQMRNLEDVTGFAICDREAVILNVFARHARTRKARIQVEIAHLEYLRPRIHGLGLEMDQQAGGVMAGRGPGETVSELMARRLDGRLAELRKRFARLSRSGVEQRKGRGSCRRIALVGYTNAGKTSLMNALTRAELSARDQPFETLDTTSRCLTRHGGDVILSDTVGFIRRLPERLLASFESTLAEIREASLLVLVVDVSDPECAMHIATTDALLARLDAHEVPRLYVFNKADRLPEPPLQAVLDSLSGDHPFALISTRDPDAVARLEERLLATVRQRERIARVFIPYRAAEAMSLAYARCRVLDTEAATEGLFLTLAGAPQVIDALERQACTNPSEDQPETPAGPPVQRETEQV